MGYQKPHTGPQSLGTPADTSLPTEAADGLPEPAYDPMEDRYINFDFKTDEMTDEDWEKVEAMAFHMQNPKEILDYAAPRVNGFLTRMNVRRVIVKECDAALFKLFWSDRTTGNSQPYSAAEIASEMED